MVEKELQKIRLQEGEALYIQEHLVNEWNYDPPVISEGADGRRGHYLLTISHKKRSYLYNTICIDKLHDDSLRSTSDHGPVCRYMLWIPSTQNGTFAQSIKEHLKNADALYEDFCHKKSASPLSDKYLSHAAGQAYQISNSLDNDISYLEHVIHHYFPDSRLNYYWNPEEPIEKAIKDLANPVLLKNLKSMLALFKMAPISRVESLQLHAECKDDLKKLHNILTANGSRY